MSWYQVCHTVSVTCHDIRCVTLWVWHISWYQVCHTIGVITNMSQYQLSHCTVVVIRHGIRSLVMTWHDIRFVKLWVWHVTISYNHQTGCYTSSVTWSRFFMPKCHIVTLVTFVWSEHDKKLCARQFLGNVTLGQKNVTLARARSATKFWKVRRNRWWESESFNLY